MALTDSTTLNADASAGGFFSGLSNILGNAIGALTPVATTVLTAKYTAEAAKYDAKAKTAVSETGAAKPVNAVAVEPASFNWKHPGVIIGAAVAALVALALVFRRR